MTTSALHLWLLSLPLLLQGGPAMRAPQNADDRYVFVYLNAGAKESELSREELSAATAGHFRNMARLAEEGVLLIAGPLAEPRGEGRGVFVFDVPNLERAHELTRTDPAVRAGALSFDARVLRSPSPLRRLPDLERAFQALRARDADVPDDYGVRPYVLVTSLSKSAEQRDLEPLVSEGLVVMRGRLEGGERDGTQLFVLDVESFEEANEMLWVVADDEKVTGWQLESWHASHALAMLRRLAHVAAPALEIAEIPEDGPRSVFRPAFAKLVDVFGVPVVATKATPDAKVLHAANLLAQYIDNDEDGTPDDPLVLDVLRMGGAFLAMTATESELERLAFSFEAAEREGFMLGQDLYGDETFPDGPPHAWRAGRFDAAIEEVLHLVSFGYEIAYPETFGFQAGSSLAAAMDLARGGQYARIPDPYPGEAWYHYDDYTCDYGCQAAEYFYWALTSLLGAQSFPGRADEIAVEWELATPDRLRAGDPAVVALLTDPRFNLPQVLPDGSYRR